MKTFKGGLHPDDKKYLSADKPVEEMPLTDKIVIPVSQHLGRPAIPFVKQGDTVITGQLIAQADSDFSANVHSSVSGIVEAVQNYNHPVYGSALSIIIKPSLTENQNFEYQNKTDWRQLDAALIKRKIYDSGIVGLGGATFPAYVKLNPPQDKKIDTVIINAVECEPYLTADHRLMLEHSAEIIEGAEIIKYIMNVDNIFIGIEANKKDAFELFKNSRELKAELLKVKYPQGAEKQLIDAITGRRVPPGKLPMDVGVVVINVGTVFAIYESVVYNKPLIDRILTVSGKGIKNPKNLKCRIGTLWTDIIKYCGGMDNTLRLVMGGPMMGVAQFTEDVPVIKGVSGILALTKEEVGYTDEEQCLRCGKCVRGCPMQLLPSEINKMCDASDLEQLYNLNISDCIECGSCSYICPANKKIIQKIRKFKTKVRK